MDKLISEKNDEFTIAELKAKLPKDEFETLWDWLHENASEFPPDMDKTQGHYFQEFLRTKI